MTFGLLLLGAVAFSVTSPASSAVADDLRGAETPAPLFVLRNPEIVESSGVALSRSHRLIWTHNDASNPPIVFGLAPTGETQVRVTVDDAAAEDWEDVAVATIDGVDWIYLNDVGDAYLVRKDQGLPYRREFEIVRFPEPTTVPQDGGIEVTVEVFPVVFEDEEGVNVESMVVLDSGEIVLVEKLEADERPARVWRIEEPAEAEPNVPVLVAEIPMVGASGADVTLDGSTMVVRNDEVAAFYDLDAGLPEAFDEPVATFEMPPQERGEGVAFTHDAGGLVLTSEGADQSLWFVPVERGATPAFGPVERASPRSESSEAPAPNARARDQVPVTYPVLAGVALLVLTSLGVAARSWRRSPRMTAADSRSAKEPMVSASSRDR